MILQTRILGRFLMKKRENKANREQRILIAPSNLVGKFGGRILSSNTLAPDQQLRFRKLHTVGIG